MAELFSLMPDSSSCNDGSVEATRTRPRFTLPASGRRNAPATGEISRDPRRARPCACHPTGSKYALEMTPSHRFVSFRAHAGAAYRVVRATSGSAAREESRPRHSHALSIERANLSSTVAADGSSAIGGSRLWPRRKRPKFDDQKSCYNEPIDSNSAASTRSLFFEPLKKIPNEPTEFARDQKIQGTTLPKICQSERVTPDRESSRTDPIRRPDAIRIPSASRFAPP